MTKILVVIDMQNDFIDGALGTKEAAALVPKVMKKIKDYDGRIIATRDTHHENYLETLEGKKLPVKHCVEETEGWKLNTGIATTLLDAQVGRLAGVINKPTFGSFELIDRIADMMPQVEEIEICGLCTDICVISNALLLRAAYPDVKIVVNKNLTEGVTLETKEAALTAMKMCQIEVVED